MTNGDQKSKRSPTGGDREGVTMMMEELLTRKLMSRTARICVVGLGYVGLPLAVEKAKAGFKVVGIDMLSDRVAMVNRGENYIPDVLEVDLQSVVAGGYLQACSEYDVIRECDVITICVPTPLGPNKQPDISYIVNVVDNSLPHLKRGQLMVLESTTYPGTTEEVIAPRVRSCGLRIGEDFFLAFSPERVDPGNRNYNVANTPKVVGGVTPSCTRVASVLYSQVVHGEVHTVSSPRVAEMEKLLENIFRIVNISLVNEMALLCERMGIDIWEVIEAAKTKPFGFMAFYPGPGLGGHCIPLDPFYLSWKAKEYGFSTRFIELAGEINDNMPRHVVTRAMEYLNELGKPLKRSRVLLLGLAYKRDVDDLRESPALRVAELLIKGGADVAFHDPYVPRAELGGRVVQSIPLTRETLERQDLVIITTDHSNVDYGLVVEHAPAIYDTRNALRGHRSPKIRRLGA